MTIREELVKASGLVPMRRENDLAFLVRVQGAICTCDPKIWEGLSPEAQDWNNLGSEQLDKDGTLPPFPDEAPAPAPAAAESTGRRTRSAAPAPAPAPVYEPKLDDEVKVTSKRGKVTEGFLVDMTDTLYVLNADAKGPEANDIEIPRDGATIELFEEPAAAPAPAPSTRSSRATAPAEPPEPEVGDTVEAITSRGRVIVGIATEITDTELVLKDLGGEVHELIIANCKSIVAKVKAAGAPATAAPAANGRRTRGAAAAPAPADEGVNRRARNGGVSVGHRMREIVCDNFNITQEEVEKILKKENLEFRPATVGMNIKDTKTIIGLLRDRKLLK